MREGRPESERSVKRASRIPRSTELKDFKLGLIIGVPSATSFRSPEARSHPAQVLLVRICNELHGQWIRADPDLVELILTELEDIPFSHLPFETGDISAALFVCWCF